MREMKCLSATGQLGYGIPKEAFDIGVSKSPDFIGGDMGSLDPGPYYLGSGQTGRSKASIRRDLEMILLAGRRLAVPVLLGSAITSGADPHLAEALDILKEIANDNHLHFRLALIHSEVPKDYVKAKLARGDVSPCGPAPNLTQQDVERATHIVGQAGVEPFIRALEQGAEVVLAGRACDCSVFAALPILRGFDQGLAIHAAKIIECASMSADPGGRDAMMAYLHDDHFLLETQNPAKRCTEVSVASHALYEQSDPFVIREPGGYVDLSSARYQQFDDKRVKVSGSRWVPEPYTVKLEGAEKIGYRFVTMGGVRDPIMIEQIELVIQEVSKLVASVAPAGITAQDYSLNWRVYGKNGVMGPLEPVNSINSHEIFVLVDVVARTREIAQTICGSAKQYLLHYYYPGILATSGNLAIPFGPESIDVGDVYRFNVHHLVRVEDPCELFPMEIIDL